MYFRCFVLMKRFIFIHSHNQYNQTNPIWIENESQRIGLLNLPKAFYETILAGNLIVLNIPFEQRLGHILEHYGKFDGDKLVAATMRIQKRLGGLDTKNAITFLLEGNIKACFDVLLKYYDKQYERSGERVGRKSVIIDAPVVNPKQNAALILKQVINVNDNH